MIPRNSDTQQLPPTGSPRWCLRAKMYGTGSQNGGPGPAASTSLVRNANSQVLLHTGQSDHSGRCAQ